MGFSYWLRVSIMILAFAGTVMVIREVNQPGGLQRTKLFGLLGTPGVSRVADVNLCPTRVTRLTTESGDVFRQDGLTWIRETKAGPKPLDQVAVEKWFAHYCRTEGAKVAASATVKPVLKVEFISGEPQTLIRSAGGEYEWMGQPFASPVMSEALEALSQL